MLSKVSIIIPHFNGYPLIGPCLESLRKITYPDIEILVINNKSTDDSPQKIKSNFPEVTVIDLDKTYGFAKACNEGLSRVVGEFALILNNDTVVEKDFLEPLVFAMKDPQVSAVQGKIMNFFNKNEFDYAGAAGGYMDRYGYTLSRGRVFETKEIDQGQYDQEVEIFWACGSCMLLRLQDLRKNQIYFDETFGMYGEEIDLCWQLKLLGKKIIFTPESKIYHQSRGSTHKKNS